MLFRYLAARWRYRGLSAKRFISASLGLERRAHYLSVFWRDHLSRSRAAQARWAQHIASQKKASGGILTVLGAGPLLDFNATPLSRSFSHFRLVDASPFSIAAWGRLNVPVQPVITDITNCIELWSNAIRQFRGAWTETMRFIEALAADPVAAYAPPTDALLSLNILSQLEVGWQETVEPILRQRFGNAFVHQHEQEWLNAIRPTSGALAEQHLIAFETSRARDILLISDAEYIDYTGRRYDRLRWQAPPLQWSESGEWQVDPDIRYESTAALEGINLTGESLMRRLPSYQLQWQENWLWHIAPNGVETTNVGKLHRVAAFCLRHCDADSD